MDEDVVGDVDVLVLDRAHDLVPLAFRREDEDVLHHVAEDDVVVHLVHHVMRADLVPGLVRVPALIQDVVDEAEVGAILEEFDLTIQKCKCCMLEIDVDEVELVLLLLTDDDVGITAKTPSAINSSALTIAFKT